MAKRPVELHVLARCAVSTLACVALVSCASTPAATSLPQPYDTKYEFRLVSAALQDEWATERMYWIDNDRLLFRADVYEGGTRATDKKYGLYLWDERSRSLRQLEGAAFGVCYADGILSYAASRGDHLVYLEGRLENLKETPLAPGTHAPERINCRAVPPAAYPYREGQVPLIGGGVFELTRSDSGVRRLWFYPDGKSERIALPMNATHTGLDLMRYSEFTKTYVFLSSVIDRSRGVRPFWQLALDGSIQTFELPRGPWSSGVKVPLPTSKGWLLGTSLNGVYLMDGSEIRHVSPGQVRDMAVSPDGCRAALKMHFGGGSSLRPMPVYTVDLCREGARK